MKLFKFTISQWRIKLEKLLDILEEKESVSVREIKAELLVGSREFDEIIKKAIDLELIEASAFDYDEVGQKIPTAYRMK